MGMQMWMIEARALRLQAVRQSKLQSNPALAVMFAKIPLERVEELYTLFFAPKPKPVCRLNVNVL